MINNQLDIKLGHFTQEELYLVLRKRKNRKLPVLMKNIQKLGKQGISTSCSDIAIPYITRTQLTEEQKIASSPSWKKVLRNS